MIEEQYLLKEEGYPVIGCCMKVHNELDCGFLEPVYQEVLAYEFNKRAIPFAKEKVVDIYYDGVLVKKNILLILCALIQ